MEPLPEGRGLLDAGPRRGCLQPRLLRDARRAYGDTCIFSEYGGSTAEPRAFASLSRSTRRGGPTPPTSRGLRLAFDACVRLATRPDRAANTATQSYCKYACVAVNRKPGSPAPGEEDVVVRSPPARGATARGRRECIVDEVSIHTHAKGDTPRPLVIADRRRWFDPRPREGAIQFRRPSHESRGGFIYAREGGDCLPLSDRDHRRHVSIHAASGGAIRASGMNHTP